jgi:hypothetical protein
MGLAYIEVSKPAANPWCASSAQYLCKSQWRERRRSVDRNVRVGLPLFEAMVASGFVKLSWATRPGDDLSIALFVRVETLPLREKSMIRSPVILWRYLA